MTPEQIEEGMRLEKAATKGPWDTDYQHSDGSYGDGPDAPEGFDSYCVHADGKEVCNTLDSGVFEIEEEHDEDHFRAWDEQGRRNMELIAYLRNNAQSLLEAAREVEALRKAVRACQRELLDINSKCDDGGMVTHFCGDDFHEALSLCKSAIGEQQS